MITAKLISLSDGQSYSGVRICEDADIDALGIERIFEDWTGCFIYEDAYHIVHHWKIKVIHLTVERFSGPKAIKTKRLVLDGDIVYEQATIIHSDNWERFGIPLFFVKRGGIAGQMAFSCHEGTFITHDVNCTSLILADLRKMGVTRASQPQHTPMKVSKKSTKPDTIHGRIIR